ncbi:MAG: dipeptidase [Bacteroidota bacterium]
MTPIIEHYIESHQKRFLEELLALLRIPSVGADPTCQAAMQKAATYIKDHLVEAGADEAQLIQTAGQPIIYAEKMIDPLLPTILVYGHYDVQPADPLDLWDTPPFDPNIRQGSIYARGAADDKGQLFAQIKAFEVMVRTEQLPCNVKFLIEGEEEIQSPNLAPFLEKKENQKMLQADVVLVSDTSMPSPDQPVILVGLRGAMMFEITIKGPNRDLHSGSYGGVVNNPIHALCTLLAHLRDDDQKITVPGFYHDVRTLSKEERKSLVNDAFTPNTYQKDIGLQANVGEKGYNTIERLTIRPTLEVNGIWGGTIGKKKTVLPATAHAILSMRLVPDQEWTTIQHQFEEHIHHLAKTLPALAGTQVTIAKTAGSNALLIPSQSRSVQAMKKAFKDTWKGKPPLCMRHGASIPVLTTLHEKLDAEIALLGIGLDDDNIHSPNEKFGIENYLKGIATIVDFYRNFVQS